MSFLFDPTGDLIRIPGKVKGPLQSGSCRLAVDTGSTRTSISRTILEEIGYEPMRSQRFTSITMGNGIVRAPMIEIERITVLGRRLESLLIVAHDIPARSGIDGLLGLDFFRDCQLHIDFRAGRIDLKPPLQ